MNRSQDQSVCLVEGKRVRKADTVSLRNVKSLGRHRDLEVCKEFKIQNRSSSAGKRQGKAKGKGLEGTPGTTAYVCVCCRERNTEESADRRLLLLPNLLKVTRWTLK